MHETVYFLGRFHVLALHLPIGIGLAAVLLEWVAARKRFQALAVARSFLWGATALSSVLTVALGYMHFSEGGFEGPSASAHRFFGTGVALLATAIWIASVKLPELHRPIRIFVSGLLLLLLTMTGHYGGNLTHGSTYLVEYAPQPLRSVLGLEPGRRRVESLAQADPYHDVVRPMLQARCGTCHNDEKRSGGFSVATYQSTLAGGETGSVVVVGRSADSELFRRVTLPRDAEDFMPAEGKTPLTTEQTEILRWWIDAGAPADELLGETNLDSNIRALLTTELGINGSERSSEPAIADAQLVAALNEAGFLVRQVSQSDARLTVRVLSPGKALAREQLDALLMAAPQIVELDLQDSKIEDEDLEGFEQFVELVRLRLSGNEVTDKGLATLASLGRLQYLNLYGNQGVTDAGLDTLAAVAALRNLYVWRTGVSQDGATRLSETRPGIVVELGAVPEAGQAGAGTSR